jgi:anti-sigma factor RsiW
MKRQADEPMQCSEARAAIQARLDEPLPAEQETALSRHVTECKACGTYQAELGAMCDALRSMPVFELPAKIREDVRSATGKHDAQ